MSYPLLLHSRHSRGEVLYETFGAWVVPWRFSSFEAEYETLRRGAGLIDYSSQAFIQVQGAERASFLHSLLSQHIKRLMPGSSASAALLTPNAKIIVDLLALCEADSLWLMSEATRAAAVAETLNRYLFSEQVTITNHERRHAVLALEGPQAATALKRRGIRLPTEPGQHQRLRLENIPLWIIRRSLIGGAGFLCITPIERAFELWQWLQRKASTFKPVGWEALNVARIEAGIPWFGIDMNEENLLPETGLESTAASDDKGCYVGQEIIARLGTYGSVSKKLMGLRIAGKEIPAGGEAIVDENETVGSITSACYSPALKQPIALGYLKRGYDEAGRTVTIRHGEKRLQAEVAPRPLVLPVADEFLKVS